jgi:hypothetical protein
MGREVGDIGFNAWLGKPSQTAMDRTSRLFEQLDHESQKEVVEKLYSAFRNTAPDFSKIGLSKAQVDKIYDKEKIKSDRSMLDNPQHHAFEQT